MSKDLKLWSPTKEQKEASNLTRYLRFLKENHGYDFKDYHELYLWSVDQIEDFWKSIYTFCDVIDHGKLERVLSGFTMPGSQWFGGSKVNYAEHIFRWKTDKRPAVIYNNERQRNQEISWSELEQKVASFSNFLRANRIGKGDAIVGFLPNIPESIIAFLAASSIGAIWSSCSPDFGADSVLERFEQIDPKVFIFADGYTYNGRKFDKRGVASDIIKRLDNVELTIGVGFLENSEHFQMEEKIIPGQSFQKNPLYSTLLHFFQSSYLGAVFFWNHRQTKSYYT